MNIITGYRGEPHITAQEDRDLNLGVVGNSLNDVYVLDVGQKLEADIVTANEIRIRDGIMVMQGCAASIDYGAYDTIEISNGALGMQRIDIIAAQYEKDADTSVENVSLVVVEGTPDAADPQPPTLTGGDLQGGDTFIQMPLYYVNLDGVSIDSIEAKYKMATNLDVCTLSPATQAKWNDIAGGASNDEILDYLADNSIIEQGYDGSRWYYRKFANGFGECFARFTPTTGSGTAQGSLYYHTYSINADFPFAFIALPVLLLAPSSGGTGIVGDVNYTPTKINTYSTYRGNAGTVASAISVHAFGRWK